MDTRLALDLTVLLLVANGTPALTGLLMRGRWNAPLDGGHVCRDGQRLLGSAKTVRGLLSSLVATTLLAGMLGFSWSYGITFGCLAMLGDTISSFTKRRLGYQISCARPVLDQLPESLLPLLVLEPATEAAAEIVVAATAFLALDLLLSSLVKSDQARCR